MKKYSKALLLVFLVLFTISMSCKTTDIKMDPIDIDDTNPGTKDTIVAKILSVKYSGNSGNYNFQVMISSPDTGCNQYANWWEVLTDDGILIYRRVLGHSHVSEQPFVRSGGGVTISHDDIVIVRAHMNSTGYGNQVFKGSVKDGFSTFEMQDKFAADVETQEPLPSSCAF